MGIKNYICVSCLCNNAGESKDKNIQGVLMMSINGQTTYEQIMERMAEYIFEKYNVKVDPSDITITGISEVSKRLFKRLKDK